MEGTIIKILHGQYSVDVDGVVYQTSPRGLFRHRYIKPIVGDRVILDENNYLINEVLPRKSSLKRPAIANINQILLVFSLSEPCFSYYLALKYLTYAHYEGIKASLVLTKTDIDNLDDGQKIKNDFAKIGIDVYLVSNKTKEGMDELTSLFKNNITCLIGQTGVGKSSLLNNLNPDYARQVGEYSKALGRGKHETKEVILLPYMDGYVADTPGFSSLELEIPLVDISHHFPGMIEESFKCFYNDCLHVNEPKCAVKEKFEEGNIPSIFYESYLKLLQEVKENNHG